MQMFKKCASPLPPPSTAFAANARDGPNLRNIFKWILLVLKIFLIISLVPSKILATRLAQVQDISSGSSSMGLYPTLLNNWWSGLKQRFKTVSSVGTLQETVTYAHYTSDFGHCLSTIQDLKLSVEPIAPAMNALVHHLLRRCQFRYENWGAGF